MCCCLFLVAKLCPAVWNPWTVARQAPLSMGLSRQEYWSGLPFPPPKHIIASTKHDFQKTLLWTLRFWWTLSPPLVSSFTPYAASCGEQVSKQGHVVIWGKPLRNIKLRMHLGSWDQNLFGVGGWEGVAIRSIQGIQLPREDSEPWCGGKDSPRRFMRGAQDRKGKAEARQIQRVWSNTQAHQTIYQEERHREKLSPAMSFQLYLP